MLHKANRVSMRMLAISLPVSSAAVEADLKYDIIATTISQTIQQQSSFILPFLDKIHLARSNKVYPIIPPTTRSGLLFRY